MKCILKVSIRKLLPVLMTLALLLPFVSGLHVPVRVSAASGKKLYGVDISTYQGDIDWPVFAANNIDFVIMRGGRRVSESSAYLVDDRFEQNYAGARSVGLEVGVYLYCGVTTWVSFEKTVDQFLDTIKGKQFDFPVFLDVEADAQTKLGKTVMTKYVLDALDMIRNAGFEAGVYANLNWFQNYLDGEAVADRGYPLWLARYTYDCERYDYSDTYSMWQYSDKGDLKGHGGTAIDLDISYVDFNYQSDCRPVRAEEWEQYLPFKSYVSEKKDYPLYYADLTTPIPNAAVHAADECTIQEVYTNGWCKVNYPAGSGEKMGFMPLDAFVPAAPGTFLKIKDAMPVALFSRADLEEKTDIIAAGGICRVITQQDGRVMIIYPIADGWRTGWYAGKVWTAADTIFLTDYIHGRVPISEEQLAVYDLNSDGIADVFDLLLVRRRVLGNS